MDLGLRTLVSCGFVFFLAQTLHAEQITSNCRITAVDPGGRTVTLIRKTANGEKSGVAKVAQNAQITVAGKSAALNSLPVPADATVVYETTVSALVRINVSEAANSSSGVSTDSVRVDAAALAQTRPFAGDLQNTAWDVKDSDGTRYLMVFREKGVLHYCTSFGFHRGGVWQRDGDKLTVDVNEGYATLEGTVAGQSINGRGRSRNGQNWLWQAEPRRIDAGN